MTFETAISLALDSAVRSIDTDDIARRATATMAATEVTEAQEVALIRARQIRAGKTSLPAVVADFNHQARRAGWGAAEVPTVTIDDVRAWTRDILARVSCGSLSPLARQYIIGHAMNRAAHIAGNALAVYAD